MRRTEQSMDRARALASLVLPTPGTSSMSRCPSASMTASASRTVALLPSMTCSMLAMMASVAARKSSLGSGPPGWSQVGVVTGLLQVVLAPLDVRTPRGNRRFAGGRRSVGLRRSPPVPNRLARSQQDADSGGFEDLDDRQPDIGIRSVKNQTSI